jgi:Ger(x)C family germination protein
LLLLLALTVSGCWDRIEIEERAYVLGMAIDLPKDNKMERKVTIAIPSVKGGATSGSSGGGSSKVQLNTFSAVAPTIYEAVMPMQNKLSKTLFFGHLKVLILSADCAGGSLAPWLDFFDRFANIPRAVMIAVCQGEADKTFKNAFSSEQLPPLYLYQLLMDTSKYGYAPHRNSNEILTYINEAGAGFLLPQIKVNKDNLEVAGSAVLKGNKMVGTLNQKETRGVLWLTGEVHGGAITLPAARGRNRLSFAIQSTKRMIKPHYKRDGINFELKIVVEGSLEEYFGNRIVLDTKTLAQIEEQLEDVVKGEIACAVEKLQSQYKTDAIGLGDYVRKWNPKRYHEAGAWNDYFAEKVKIEIPDLAVQVRRTGVLR